MTSESGVVTVANADNDVSGPGAIFDFSGLLPDGVLAPEKSSKPLAMTFGLKNVRLRPVDEKETWKSLQHQLIDLDLIILGEPAAPAAPAEAKK